ncbi:epoxide hydrolase family protein [Mycolicibacterium sp. XJ1819]
MSLTGTDDVRPFSISVPEADLEDLRARLRNTRWPDPECVDDWSQGLPLSYASELAAYWADGYDWGEREARLNRLPQFVTEIDGIDIHFIHHRSAHDDAIPLLITHGWPGSVFEFAKVIEPLVDPTAHGGKPEDAFHVVCPSLPGYGFSGKPTATGWGIDRIAEAWDALMVRLGYRRYVAQGGDWGAMVTTQIGRNRGHCVAIHTNMPIAGPPDGGLGELSATEQQALARLGYYDKWESGYAKQQSTRPQTLGYGLTDSPAGQMAWIVEKFAAWTDCGGHPENAVSRDELLDNVTLYWITGSATSSARLYWESFAGADGAGRVELPTGVAVFPAEIIQSPRSWCEAAYNVTHWTEMPRGGHFGALEQPQLFVDDVRTFFSAHR